MAIILFPLRLIFGLVKMALRTVMGLVVGLALIVGVLYVVGRACEFDPGKIIPGVASTPVATPLPAISTLTPAQQTAWEAELLMLLT